MRELIGLRIRIERGFDGKSCSHKYPPFDDIEESKRGNMPWVYFFDNQGTGWLYDNCCGHNETDEYSPEIGVKYGIVGLPEPFALEALARWPNEVERLTEAEFEEFYNNRTMARVPELKYDTEQLDGLKARYGDLPFGDSELIKVFTDIDETTKADALAVLQVEKKVPLTIEELAKVDKLVIMDPDDCRALDSENAMPGVRRNKYKHYSDFKIKRDMRIK